MFGAAWATGQPEPWQLGFQPSVTEVGDRVHGFYDLLMWIITLITLFVTGLLAYVIIRFNRKANPDPSKTSHNTLIEVIWTGVPILILVLIAVPSFKLLYFQNEVGEADLTIKATGHQWYWSYEYPDEDGLTYDAIMLSDEERKPGQPRLLATDTHVVVPVGKKVRMLVTASDVIHAWTIPAFGVKVDAVPGRINETWFAVEKEGIYYGQCSELCGVRHAFMPIVVEAVSQEKYDAWLAEAKELYATDSAAPAITVAAASTQTVE
ncbi:MAG: cytochrome c oxidase subunit II [Alphaproteobacteria bacterium]|nr:MAG: cytochrome c oxidase subunit II [Alphaproteobacteria bacterium]